jgi:hypothetical protein
VTTAVDFSVLDDVKPGDTLIVRFKKNATDDLIYIQAMRGAKVIDLDPGELMVNEAIRLTGDWDHDSNRTQELTVGSYWDRVFFEGRMRRALESIKVKQGKE